MRLVVGKNGRQSVKPGGSLENREAISKIERQFKNCEAICKIGGISKKSRRQSLKMGVSLKNREAICKIGRQFRKPLAIYKTVRMF